MAIVQNWLSSNKNRAYPFVENSDTGVLPSWILLDFSLYDSNSDGNNKVTCTGFEVQKPRCFLKFSYGNTDFSAQIGLGTDISLVSLDVTDTIRARLAVYGGGSEYDLSVEDGLYKVDVDVLPTRIIAVQNTRKAWSLNGVSGKIHLKDGYNTVARLVNGAITVSVGDGYGLGTYCPEESDFFDCSKALLFMNGQHADTDGNINIVGGAGVTVQTGRTALVDGKIVPAITIKAADTIKEVL